MRAVADDAWVPAKDMKNAEVAETTYVPKGWPGAPRAIVRRVRVEAADIKSDPRSRRLRTIDKDELKAVRQGRTDHAYSYSMILTSLDGDMAELEHWFRERAQVEERLKDSKYGAALRHLPSGQKVVNAVWMWSGFLALNISAVLSAFARAAPGQATQSDGPGTGSTSPSQRGRRRRRHRPLRAHGKRLRREIVNVPGRLARHARGLVVHLHPSQKGGPLVRVYRALRNLPSFAPT